MTRVSSIIFCALLLIFCSGVLHSQPQKGRFINVGVGLGITSPYDETDVIGSGFYAQAEYVYGVTSWFGIRPYAGILIASGDDDQDGNPTTYRIKTNAFLLGAKVRIAAPIPYVAPFIESGIGISAGSFETRTAFVNLSKNRVLVHIPFSLGLAVGRQHNVEIKLTYYFTPAAEQFSGAFAGGFSLPLN